jgi:hypothetical protein
MILAMRAIAMVGLLIALAAMLVSTATSATLDYTGSALALLPNAGEPSTTAA